MAFDAALPSFVPGKYAASAHNYTLPVRAGGDISHAGRLAITLGYAAFGATLGALTAVLIGRPAPELLAVLVGVPLVMALVVAIRCAPLLNLWATPLLALAVSAALAAPIGTFFMDRGSAIGIVAGVFIAALVLTNIFFGKRFAAAFSVAMLGLLLAAPIGSAAAMWTFGR